MRLLMMLITILLACGSSHAAQETCRIRSDEGWWTRPVELDTVRDGWLVFVEGETRDSISVNDVDVLRRTRTSHVAGGLVGFTAGLVGAVLIVVPYAIANAGIGHPQDRGSDLPLFLAGASITIGTTWGAIVGLDVHPTDDLTLVNLDEEQRAAALHRFILDSQLLETK